MSMNKYISGIINCLDTVPSLKKQLVRAFKKVEDDISAAGGQNHTYSTTEQVVGKWIDGTTDVYEKVIDFESLPNNTTKSVAHNISNADIVFIHDAFAINSSGNSFALPKASDAFSYQIDISVNRTNVEIWCGSDRSAYNGYVVLRYTKSS